MSLQTETHTETPALKPGDKVILEIHDIAFGGDGVGRTGEFVVFVPFVLLGEQVEVEVIEVKKRFARARLSAVLRPSPERVQPPCPYFGNCGGCQYQHIDYPAQLRLKRKQIADLFQRIGRIDPEIIAPVVPSPQPYGYRNRIMVRSQWNKVKQGLNIGFIRYDNRLVVDIEECKIAEPELNRQLQHVRAHPPPKGGIKVVLRVFPKDWEVPRDSFFQNNFFILPALVERVRGMVRSSGVRRLIDLYCGVGFFSLELADLVETFVGVELDRLAIEAARRNAATRGITHGEFINAPAETVLPGLLEQAGGQPAVVVLDPPRTGCPPESLELLRRTRPSQILYVSCHPATLARDLNILCADQVYTPVKVVPFDMFPQTQHVECVVDLRSEVNR